MVEADPRRAVGVQVRLAAIVMDRVQDSANIGIGTGPEASAYGDRPADVAVVTATERTPFSAIRIASKIGISAATTPGGILCASVTDLTCKLAVCIVETSVGHT